MFSVNCQSSKIQVPPKTHISIMLIMRNGFCFVMKGLELANAQNKEEDISVLPTLKISDIEPELKRTTLDFKEVGKKSV